MQLPISVKLRPSRNLALLLVAMHAVALLIVSDLELVVWIKLALLLLIAISAWNCRKYWHGAQRIILLSLRDKGALAYVRLNGATGDASVDRQSTVTPWLTVILLKSGKGLESLVLLPDALNPDDYRRLRVWLRWQSAIG
jgi:toxin CptA